MAAGRPIIAVQRLSKTYLREVGLLRRRQGQVRAVDQVSLALARGETLALVGESGCGKTTTGLCIVRSEEPTGGQIWYTPEPGAPPRDVVKMEAEELRALRRAVRVVVQDPFASLNARMTVLRIVGEPVSALGVSVQAQILSLIRSLQAQRAMSYLFIAHNLAVVRYLSDRVAIMYLGRIVELASRAEIFARPQHPYTELLLTSSPNPDPTARKLHLVKAGESPSHGVRPTGCPFHPRCPYREPRCTVEEPELTEAGTENRESHLVACHLHRQLSLRTFAD